MNSTVGETRLVRFSRSPIHGVGGFAKAEILKGVRVIEYASDKISAKETLLRCETNNEFIFALGGEFYLDGNVEWNPARFLNHSCAPNCEAILEDERIWLIALREIQAGEEITFSYGYDLESYKEHPCRCGVESCVGYIVAEEYFPHLRNDLNWQNSAPE